MPNNVTRTRIVHRNAFAVNVPLLKQMKRQLDDADVSLPGNNPFDQIAEGHGIVSERPGGWLTLDDLWWSGEWSGDTDTLSDILCQCFAGTAHIVMHWEDDSLTGWRFCNGKVYAHNVTLALAEFTGDVR